MVTEVPTRPHLAVVARGWALNLLGTASHGVLTLVLVFVITRGLGAGEAGAFFEAVAVFSILTNSTTLGADTGIVRMLPRHRALGRRADVMSTISVALWPVLVVGTVAAILLFATATRVSEVVADPTYRAVLATYLRVLAPFLPISAGYTVLIAATRGFGTMLPSTIVDKLARPALQPVLLALVLAAGLRGATVAFAWAGPLALAAVLASLWLASLIRLDGAASAGERAGRLRALAAEFWRFTAPRSLAAVFQVTILWLDTLMIGALASTREAGIYTAATRYVLIGMLAAVAILQVLAPKLSELLAREDHDEATHVFQTATAWLIGLNWPIYLTLIVFAPFLLSLFGPEFVEGQGAVVVLASTMLVATAIGPVDIVLLMGGKSAWNLINTGIALALNVVLNLILIPRFGIVGASVAWSASILFNNLAPLAQVWHFLRMHPFGRGFIRITLAAGACYGGLAFVIRALLGATLAGFVASGLVATGVFLTLVWRSREGLELRALRQALRRPSRDSAKEPAITGVR